MAGDKTQLLRLIFIDRKIREGMASGRLANCNSMAAEYEVSRKSILRDIDYLRNQRDAPIVYDESRRGYYYSEEQYRLPAMDLTESDLFALCIAEKALARHANSPVYGRLRKVFDKIESALPASVSVQPDWVDHSLSVVEEDETRIDSEIWDAVSDRVRQHRALDIRYQRPGAESDTDRRVDPFHLVRYHGEWYMIGHCYFRQAIRTFALSRIRSAALRKEVFTVPEDFDGAAVRTGRFSVFGGESRYLVRIRFDCDHAPYVLERQWHPEQELSSNNDGSVDLTFPASHLPEVKRWVLSWGNGARVLAPEELLTAVREELAGALAGYT